MNLDATPWLAATVLLLGCAPGPRPRESTWSRPSATVRLSVRDDAGHPLPARVSVWTDGVPTDPAVFRGGLGWRTRRQGFVPGPGELSVYVSGDAELTVPAGRARMVVTRGHAFTPVTEELELGAGETRDVAVRLTRWTEPEGWRCGDVHLHLARLHPERDGALRQLIDAEDLDVAVLVDWAGRADGRFAPGWGGWAWSAEHLAERSRTDRLVIAGQGWGRPDRACVLALLGHRTPVDGRSRHSAPAIIERVLEEGGLAMGTMGDVPTEGAILGRVAATEVLSHGRLELERWYALLSAGARLAAVAGTDTQGGAAPETLIDYHTPPGASRVCVWTDGALDGASFLDAIRAGRTYVTSGPRLELEVDRRRPGAVIAGSPATIRVRMRAPMIPGGVLRLVVNGEVAWERAADAREIDVTLERTFDESAWIAARLDGEARMPAGDVAVAHTSPVYVDVDGPVRLPDAVRAVLASIPDDAEIADSGSSTAHEREVALRWASEARATLEARSIPH